MKEISVVENSGLTKTQLAEALAEFVAQYPELKKVLILPPDFTRSHSYAGEITQILYQLLTKEGVKVHVMPALGTHMPMSDSEKTFFFSDVVPDKDILIHHWQSDTVTLGKVPSDVVSKISNGLYNEEVEVELNHRLVEDGYDLIISVGQVVPHEVVGMSNYSKNIFVGVGGRSMINKSHMLSAVCGMEKALGVIDSPVRKLYDYAQENFIDGKLPVVYVETVTTIKDGDDVLNGLFIGEARKTFEEAARLSQKLNIVHMPRRAKKVVTYLEPEELKTTWVGNKGIYRTRLSVEDGGELLILAPGVVAFGENAEMDAMIRELGYCGTERVLNLYNEGVFENRSMCAAHLIQGSTDGRFSVTYATVPEKLSKEEVESVGFEWMDYNDAVKLYNPEELEDGWHQSSDGEEFFYIGAPASGLWVCDN